MTGTPCYILTMWILTLWSSTPPRLPSSQQVTTPPLFLPLNSQSGRDVRTSPSLTSPTSTAARCHVPAPNYFGRMLAGWGNKGGTGCSWLLWVTVFWSPSGLRELGLGEVSLGCWTPPGWCGGSAWKEKGTGCTRSLGRGRSFIACWGGWRTHT